MFLVIYTAITLDDIIMTPTSHRFVALNSPVAVNEILQNYVILMKAF